MARSKDPVIARLLSYTAEEHPSGCLVWTGMKDNRGYGRFSFEGRWQSAHRSAWKILNGPIPTGMCVLHRCDNPPCVNVDHLFLGTLRDNVHDMLSKGRGKSCPGEKNGFAKLTQSIADEIRAAPGVQRRIAERFNVSPSTVSAIKTNSRWIQ